MNIVSNAQWSGWFKGMGAAGVVMNNVITAVMPFIIGALAIIFVYQIVKAGMALGKAEGPEQRKEAKMKIVWIAIAMLVTVVGPTIFLILMNTIGKTTKATSGTASPGPIDASPSLTSLAIKMPHLIVV